MKYIDAERLRAAIKEHTLFYAGQANLLDGTNTLDGYDEVLAIIDSLQQEQPEVDFEKEWDEFEDWTESYITSDYPTYYSPKEIARHFFELGLNARKED